MTTWGELVTKTLRTVLKDPTYTTWEPMQVYDALGWALDTFASHTAPLRELKVEEGDAGFAGSIDMSATTEFPLPDDILDPLNETGQVFIIDSLGDRYDYDPVDKTEWLHLHKLVDYSYVVWPDTKLHLGNAPGEGATLYVRYFGYYEKPTADNATEPYTIPRWSEKAITTLTGAFCLEGLGIQSANIDRWKDESDSGNPEHNALRAEQRFLMGQYEYLISQYPRQDRENFFREVARKTESPDYYQKWGVLMAVALKNMLTTALEDYLTQKLTNEVADLTSAETTREGKLQQDPTVGTGINVLVYPEDEDEPDELWTKDNAEGLEAPTYEIGQSGTYYYRFRLKLTMHFRGLQGNEGRSEARIRAYTVMARAKQSILTMPLPTHPTTGSTKDDFGEVPFDVQIDEHSLRTSGGNNHWIWRGWIRFGYLVNNDTQKFSGEIT